MSDTQNTPLWKQLLGAATGAAVAFVLYEGVTFASDHLQAVIAMPMAPGVSHQDQLRMSNSVSGIFMQDRRIARQQEIAARFAQAPISTATVSSSIVGPFPVRPTGTIGSPSPSVLSKIAAAASANSKNTVAAVSSSAKAIQSSASTLSVSSSSTSTSNVQVAQILASSSISSRTAVAPAAAALTGAKNAVQSSSASVATSKASSSVAVSINASASASSAEALPILPPLKKEKSRPVRTSDPVVQAKGSTLPKSGVGAGVVAVTALGAALGRRKAKKA